MTKEEEYFQEGLENGTIEERYNQEVDDILYYDTVEDRWLNYNGTVHDFEEDDIFNSDLGLDENYD